MMKLQVGDKAPAFVGSSQGGQTIRLEDYLGKKVAVYFYPKDDTPGCTKQACNLRDNYQKLLDAGVSIVGISYGSVDSKKKFATKYNVPFPLVADVDKKITESYGAKRAFFGPRRMTFVIDEKGVIKQIVKQVQTSDHADQILEAFQQRN